MPHDEGSITRWFEGLKRGDRAAAHPLWEHYFARMLGLARASIRPGAPGVAVADEEDAAASAFETFCAEVERGRFAEVNGREALWRLLAVITVRKARAQMRRARRLKRGGCEQVLREADLEGSGLDGLVDPHSRPDLAALAAEELERLLNVLDDDVLREVVMLRLEGYTCDEIAARRQCARRTVARQLELIRKLWTAAEEDDPE